MANMTLPSMRTPTPLRALSDLVARSKRGCKRPFITSIGPDCVATSACGRCLRNARVSATAGPLMQIARRPNFILTPHVAWASQEAIQSLADQLIDNIEAFWSGDPRNRVTA